MMEGALFAGIAVLLTVIVYTRGFSRRNASARKVDVRLPVLPADRESHKS
jgi:hypothetical protein